MATLGSPSSGGAERGWFYCAQGQEQGILHTPGGRLASGSPGTYS